MSTAFERMMAGLDEVEAYLSGETEAFKAHVPGEVDVKAIRKRLGLTQARFSAAFGFSLDAVKNWESHRRQPEAAGCHARGRRSGLLLGDVPRTGAPWATEGSRHPDVWPPCNMQGGSVPPPGSKRRAPL